MPGIAHNHNNDQKNYRKCTKEQKKTKTDISRQDIARVKGSFCGVLLHIILLFTILFISCPSSCHGLAGERTQAQE